MTTTNETLIEAIVRLTDAYLTRVQPTAHLTAYNVVENLLYIWQGEPGLEIPGELTEPRSTAQSHVIVSQGW